jgi:hypothetical protein
MAPKHDRTAYHSGTEDTTTITIAADYGKYNSGNLLQDVLVDYDSRLVDIEQGERTYSSLRCDAIFTKTPRKRLFFAASIFTSNIHTFRARSKLSNATVVEYDFTADASIPSVQGSSFTVNSVYQVFDISMSFSCDATFSESTTHQHSFTMDCHISLYGSVSANAIIKLNTEWNRPRVFWLDAKIIIPRGGAMDLNAIAKVKVLAGTDLATGEEDTDFFFQDFDAHYAPAWWNPALPYYSGGRSVTVSADGAYGVGKSVRIYKPYDAGGSLRTYYRYYAVPWASVEGHTYYLRFDAKYTTPTPPTFFVYIDASGYGWTGIPVQIDVSPTSSWASYVVSFPYGASTSLPMRFWFYVSYETYGVPSPEAAVHIANVRLNGMATGRPGVNFNAVKKKHYETTELVPNGTFEYTKEPWVPLHPEREGNMELVDWDGEFFETGRGCLYMETYAISSEEGGRVSFTAPIEYAVPYLTTLRIRSLGADVPLRLRAGNVKAPTLYEITDPDPSNGVQTPLETFTEVGGNAIPDGGWSITAISSPDSSVDVLFGAYDFPITSSEWDWGWPAIHLITPQPVEALIGASSGLARVVEGPFSADSVYRIQAVFVAKRDPSTLHYESAGFEYIVGVCSEDGLGHQFTAIPVAIATNRFSQSDEERGGYITCRAILEWRPSFSMGSAIIGFGGAVSTTVGTGYLGGFRFVKFDVNEILNYRYTELDVTSDVDIDTEWHDIEGLGVVPASVPAGTTVNLRVDGEINVWNNTGTPPGDPLTMLSNMASYNGRTGAPDQFIDIRFVRNDGKVIDRIVARDDESAAFTAGWLGGHLVWMDDPIHLNLAVMQTTFASYATDVVELDGTYSYRVQARRFTFYDSYYKEYFVVPLEWNRLVLHIDSSDTSSYGGPSDSFTPDESTVDFSATSTWQDVRLVWDGVSSPVDIQLETTAATNGVFVVDCLTFNDARYAFSADAVIA